MRHKHQLPKREQHFQDEWRGMRNADALPNPRGNRKERRRAERMGVTPEVYDQAVALVALHGDRALDVVRTALEAEGLEDTP